MLDIRAAHVRAFRDACHDRRLNLSLVEARRVLEAADDINDAFTIANKMEYESLDAIEIRRLHNRLRRIEQTLAALTGDDSLICEITCPDIETIAAAGTMV